MKRPIALLLLLALTLSLCACGKQKSETVEYFDEHHIPKPQGLELDEVKKENIEGINTSTYFYFFDSDTTYDEFVDYTYEYFKQLDNEGFTITKISEDVNSGILSLNSINLNGDNIGYLSLGAGENFMLIISFIT